MFKRLISITVLLFIFLTMYPISTAAEINLDVDLDIKGEPEQTEEVNENDEPHDPSTNPDSLIEQLKEKLKEPGDKLKKSDDSNKNVNMSSSAGVDYVYYQEFEPNNSMELADPYYMNTWMQAYMDYYDMDYFRFDVTRYGSITLEVFSDYYAEYYLALYDQYGSIIGVLEKEFGYNETYSINVEPGTYYLVFLEPDYYYNYYYFYRKLIPAVNLCPSGKSNGYIIGSIFVPFFN
jgi:hypothetical protein